MTTGIISSILTATLPLARAFPPDTLETAHRADALVTAGRTADWETHADTILRGVKIEQKKKQDKHSPSTAAESPGSQTQGKKLVARTNANLKPVIVGKVGPGCDKAFSCPRLAAVENTRKHSSRAQEEAFTTRPIVHTS
ncbi:hypothetical protein QBC47DRAFT_365983 [Echria macrotheca]|uniref:Uncharacterized protein n=1 Tax=Echria macrotheca TaxID=438768 RepID=A0AAJ0B3C4_9PEZI|nr:hypothetical protein QBC47DRAFT_365983 [Echria macrotheca]